MGKTNGATTTKAKAKESSKDKSPAKTERKADKVVDKKADKAVDKKVDKKADKALEKVADKKADKKGEKASTSNGSTRAAVVKPVPVKPVVPQIVYKCPFPADELAKWRQVLITRRHEITDDIAGLVKDAMDAEDGHTTPNHIAERGSDADLQDLSLGVAGEEKDVVWQIDRALRKIDANMPIPFGLCEHTKEAIPRTRLQLIPWTPLSIEGATHMERQSLTLEDLLIED